MNSECKIDIHTCFKEFRKKHLKAKERSDFWHFCHHFPERIEKVDRDIHSGDYHFGLAINGKVGDQQIAWFENFEDRFVSFYLAKILKEILHLKHPHSYNYYQMQGMGHVKAVNDLSAQLKNFTYVYKTDIKSYYYSIDQEILLKRLKDLCHLGDGLLRTLNRLITPVLFDNYTGTYFWNHSGILKGMNASPFFARLYLIVLDIKLWNQNEYYYQRFCDDIIVLARSNRKLKSAIKLIRRNVQKSKLRTRYEKSYIRKSDAPIIWLGYRIKSRSNQIEISRESLLRRDQNLDLASNSLARKKYLSRWSQ